MKKNLLLRFDWINGYGLPVFIVAARWPVK